MNKEDCYDLVFEKLPELLGDVQIHPDITVGVELYPEDLGDDDLDDGAICFQVYLDCTHKSSSSAVLHWSNFGLAIGADVSPEDFLISVEAGFELLKERVARMVRAYQASLN